MCQCKFAILILGQVPQAAVHNLPGNFSKKLSMSNARIYVAAADLLTFSGLNIDPEIKSNGYYYYTMPAMRTVTIGLDLTF